MCGEDCPRECLDCIAKENPEEIVDFIMQRSAEDISGESDYGSIENIVVELACGHHLTVESADRIAELETFYRQDDAGKWIEPSAPPKSVGGPKCPSCRQPFYLKRYGRAFKKADLDLSERNLVSKADRTLQAALQNFDGLPEVQVGRKVVASAEIADSSTEHADILASVNAMLKRAQRNGKLVDFNGLGRNISKTLGFSPDCGKKWSHVAAPELSLLNKVNSVIQQGSPHQDAWDSSYAMLFRAEMDSGKCRGEEAATRLAHRAIGPPIARDPSSCWKTAVFYTGRLSIHTNTTSTGANR